MDLVDPSPQTAQCVWSEPKEKAPALPRRPAAQGEPPVTKPGAGQLFLAEERNAGRLDIDAGMWSFEGALAR